VLSSDEVLPRSPGQDDWPGGKPCSKSS
jgi:hypothetical protein